MLLFAKNISSNAMVALISKALASTFHRYIYKYMYIYRRIYIYIYIIGTPLGNSQQLALLSDASTFPCWRECGSKEDRTKTSCEQTTGGQLKRDMDRERTREGPWGKGGMALVRGGSSATDANIATTTTPTMSIPDCVHIAFSKPY